MVRKTIYIDVNYPVRSELHIFPSLRPSDTSIFDRLSKK
jgi:hypothetical protein